MKHMSKEFWEDLDWARDNHTQLAKRYPDEWVAVINKKVVAFGKSLKRVKEEAINKFKKKDVAVFFAECGEHIYG